MSSSDASIHPNSSISAAYEGEHSFGREDESMMSTARLEAQYTPQYIGSHLVSPSSWSYGYPTTDHRSTVSSPYHDVKTFPTTKTRTERPRSSRKTDFFQDRWVGEILSTVFSLSCLMAVIVLASKLNNTWLSKWTFLLQPSTLISILVTGAQSSIMLAIAEVISQSKWLYFWNARRRLNELSRFDDASRGPLGSLKLFWPGRSGIRPFLAYGGAFVTIAALAMGPFAQQIVGLRVDKVPNELRNSSVTVSNLYQSGDSGVYLKWVSNMGTCKSALLKSAETSLAWLSNIWARRF